jgi:hypothetical protein
MMDMHVETASREGSPVRWGAPTSIGFFRLLRSRPSAGWLIYTVESIMGMDTSRPLAALNGFLQ